MTRESTTIPLRSNQPAKVVLAAAAARDVDWLALDPTRRITLLWSYADQIVQHVSPPGHDFRKVADWLDGNTSFPFLDRVGLSGVPPWYTRLTAGLTEARLTAALVASVVGPSDQTFPERSLVALRGVCGKQSGDAWSPDVALLSPPPPGPEGLWVAADPLGPDLLGRWLAPDSPLGKRSDEALATGLLDEEFAPDAVHLLVPLLSHVDVRNVSRATADRIRTAVSAGDARASFEPNMVATRNVLSVEAGLRALDDDDAGMRAILAAGARRCAGRWPGAAVGIRESGDGSAAALSILVEAALEFAVRLDRPMPERFGVFAEGVRAIVDAWPNCRFAATARLDAVVRLGDAEQADALWPVLLDLRSRS